MAINDPYPETLDDVPFAPPTPAQSLGASIAGEDALTRAVNRLAQAVEQNTLALLDNAVAASSRAHQPVQNAPQGLAPLPPVQVVANKPACPLHGVDKVAPSRNGPGFYCQSKAAPGQPANPKGYCTWHT